MRRVIVLGLFIFMPNALIAKSWSEILREKAIFNDLNFKVIKEQYESFINNIAPVIADPSIKNIPIIDNGESLIDINVMANTRITMLPNPPEEKSFCGPAYNSGLCNAPKIRRTIYLRLEKMINSLDSLSELFGYKPGEISIKVFEGLRDLNTQKNLFQAKYEEIKLQHPEFTDDEAQKETAKWVSPVKNNVPVHSTGSAIDIRLWNETTNDFVDLGKFGVIWGENKAAQTFCENITDAQKLNRLYLLMAASNVGLINYTYEYWHFSFGDRYATYWQEKNADQRIALYGAIE